MRGVQALAFELTGEVTPVRELVGGVWGARALVVMLARKDFFVRYRRAAFGLVWAVALPLVQAGAARAQRGLRARAA